MKWQKYFWTLYILFFSYVILSKVFSGVVVLPQSFHIGGLQIHYYGLIIALAVLCASKYLHNKRSEINISRSQLENLLLIVLVCGFVGARIYHVIFALDFYLAQPVLIFKIWNGGLAIFGTVIGGLIGLYFYNQLYLKINFLKLLDYLIPGLLIGQIIGRFGNLVNYELYGQPTNLPWKMFVPESFRVFPFEASSYFHPLFLYESLACLLILLVLLRYNDLAAKFHLPNRARSKFWLWLVLYGIVRIGIEILRTDSNYLLGIPQNFWISGIMIIMGLGYMIFQSLPIRQLADSLKGAGR